ncbi:MAG: hypothetical protein Q8S13_02230, partial [Dehalococcoidia bacterium]|nr:hypothetical protein [Dehalococcoidia bacterium]
QILVRASSLGEMARQEKEEVILAGVVDVGPDTANTRYKSVYRPSGTAEDLYVAGNNNYLSTATPLVDWTDIDEVLRYHAETVVDDRAIVGERRPIMWMPNTLLVARKLAGTGARILSATEVRSGTASTSDVTMVTANPLRSIMGPMRVLSSPLLDFLATVSSSNYDDSDDWFLGDFKRQFVWQEIYPLQTLRAQANDEAQFRRDIVARFKVRYFGGIAAIDERQVIKVNAVT